MHDICPFAKNPCHENLYPAIREQFMCAKNPCFTVPTTSNSPLSNNFLGYFGYFLSQYCWKSENQEWCIKYYFLIFCLRQQHLKTGALVDDIVILNIFVLVCVCFLLFFCLFFVVFCCFLLFSILLLLPFFILFMWFLYAFSKLC